MEDVAFSEFDFYGQEGMTPEGYVRAATVEKTTGFLFGRGLKENKLLCRVTMSQTIWDITSWGTGSLPSA